MVKCSCGSRRTIKVVVIIGKETQTNFFCRECDQFLEATKEKTAKASS